MDGYLNKNQCIAWSLIKTMRDTVYLIWIAEFREIRKYLFCVCVHMCVSTCICKCMYTHVRQCRGPRLMSGVFFSSSLHYVLTQEPFVKLELVCLASLVQGLPVSASWKLDSYLHPTFCVESGSLNSGPPHSLCGKGLTFCTISAA